MPSGTRIETSDAYIARVENGIRKVVSPNDLGMIVSNIGITPDLSAIYTSNSTMDTAFVQVSLNDDHSIGSYQYIDRVRRRLASEMPEVQTYFQAGGLVDSVVNQGLPAPLDIQISSNDQPAAFAKAQQIAQQLRGLSSVGDVYIPQDLKYPGLQLNIDRERGSLVGLSPKDIVDNVITALTSNGVIAPSYWIDPNTGNNYMLTVQYSNQQIGHMNMEEFENIPLRGNGQTNYTPLRSVAFTRPIDTPTEVDHYNLRRVIDVYVQPRTEALNTVSRQVNRVISSVKKPAGMLITVRGAVESMHVSFERFGIGLILSISLIYLVLMAQFASFRDPFIILMAIPPGLAGVVLILLLTGSTLNIMSLMGVIMMTGIVVSNSILIVEFAGILHAQGSSLVDAVVQSCKIRMRPILMTSLATLLGLIPMALGVEAGSEQYAPLARALIGGLAVSVVVTVFLVPAVYLLIHGRVRPVTPHQLQSRRRSNTCATPFVFSRSHLSLFPIAVCTLRAISRRDSILRRRRLRRPGSVSSSTQLPPGQPSDLPAKTPSIWRSSITRASASATCSLWRSIRSCVEARSGELPTLTGSVTAQDANDGSRVSSGSLSASRLFTRAGGGINFSQLITDFGRTTNLVASSKLEERAQQANELATREDIVLITDQAFYNALQAQALLQVAKQTVNLRQTTQSQVNQLTQNKLRSTLDLTFANVNLSQAQLLALDAQNNADAAMAALDEVLGLDHPVPYSLVDTHEQSASATG